MEKDTMSNEARAAQRAYTRAWRRANPDKVRAANRRYWEKKAAAADRIKEAGA